MNKLNKLASRSLYIARMNTHKTMKATKYKQNVDFFSFLSAAFAQAVPTYSGPSRLASVGSFGRNVGHHGIGHVDTKLGVVGHGGFNKYDAGRLVHDAVYNPRRVGVSLQFCAVRYSSNISSPL